MHGGNAAALDKFQSTPSVGRATVYLLSVVFNAGISIHALRGEGDGVTATRFCMYY